MNKKEIDLLCHFLELASNGFGNKGCNDVEEEVWNNWSLEERKEFVKEFHNWNGDPEEYNEEYLHIPDFAIISFLKNKLQSLSTSATQKEHNKGYEVNQK